ncbi:hypothetical protein [Nocardia wallacei]|uniref:hypothetical protein n=1 Tax=Nocardia wallacei TaxID=480035 RepID=UPI00245778D8|nr:hypothetical protein [Nocardia wallacei]
MTTTETASARIAFDASELGYFVDNAARDYMNALAPHLPPLRWLYDCARDGSHDMRLAAIVRGDDPAMVAGQWAEVLGIEGPQDRHHGTRHWTGHIADGQLVDIWYVADQEALDAARSRPVASDPPAS